MSIDNKITHNYACGALPLFSDARDFQMEKIPGVAAALAASLPDYVDYSQYISYVYSQGTIPCCVAASTAGLQTLYQKIEGEERIYDFLSVYWEVGGDGRRGVPTRTVLDYAREKGMPVLSTPSQRNRIESYAFTRDLDTVIAALAAGRLPVFAMLLPEDVWEGNSQSMVMTDNYHQVLAVGYDQKARRLYYLNSWGERFGKRGVGSIPFEFLTQVEGQRGYFYAYTTVDVIDAVMKSAPLRVITGYRLENGEPTTVIEQGKPLFIEGKGFGELRQGPVSVAFDGKSPVKIASWTDTLICCLVPRDISIGRYNPRVIPTDRVAILGPVLEVITSVPPAPKPYSGGKITGIFYEDGIPALYPRPGSVLVVEGVGFGSKPGAITFGSYPGTVRSWGENEIRCTLPSELESGRYVATITRADTSYIVGGDLRVRKEEPAPQGRLLVKITVRKLRSRTSVGVRVFDRETSLAVPGVEVSLSKDGKHLQTLKTSRAGSCAFVFSDQAKGKISVQATTGDGRTGSTTQDLG